MPTELSATIFRSERRPGQLGMLVIAILGAGLSGCSAISLPSISGFSAEDPSSRYVGVDPAFDRQSASSEDVYYKVRQARTQNSIVLDVTGDEMPARVLPLPTGGQSVLVSDLLKQTGVLKKLDRVEATLFRHDPNTIGGIPMAIKMSRDKKRVLAEADYALRPGDRLRVTQAAGMGMQELLGMSLGL